MKSVQIGPCKIISHSIALSHDILVQYFYIGLFLIMFFHLPAGAQKYAPTGILNSYTYGEKDGIDNSNYSGTFISSSGKIYLSLYGSYPVLTIGNNYSRSISGYNNTPFESVSGFTETKNGEIWVFQHSQVSVLRNDCIIRTIKYPPGEIIDHVGNSNYVESVSHKSIYCFDGYKFSMAFCNLDFPDSGELRLLFIGDSTYVFCQAKHAVHIYAVTGIQKIRFVTTLANKDFKSRIATVLKSGNSWYVLANDKMYGYPHHNPLKPFPIPQFLNYEGIRHSNQSLTVDGSPRKIFTIENDKLIPVYNLDIDGKSRAFEPDAGLNHKAYYAYGALQPARHFSYLKKYPSIFNNVNADEVFSLAQDSKNRIWAASYQGKLSIIEPNSITEVPVKNLHFLSGNIVVGDKMFLFAEAKTISSLLYDMNGKIIKKFTGFSGFIGYVMPNKKDVYIGTASYKGLWHTNITSLATGNPIWDTIGISKGVNLNNILTITSDTLGRIWYGQRGFGVYDPKTGKAKTFARGNEINYSVVSLLTDTWGTVWLGSTENGLLYYDTYTKMVKPVDIKRLFHPLLPDKNRINSLCVWGKWLVIGIENKILLLDLQRWHKDKGIIIRYLNPQEAAFTSKVEQNVFLIDRRDSTLWFSTSDMLYQWDVKTWLSLPIYKVIPNVIIKKGESEIPITEGQAIKIEPTQNTFSLQIWFQSRDNMPRYMSAALMLKGDSVVFPDPSLKTHSDYSNLAPGTYLFHIRIFQSDGTTSTHTYTIVVKKFWWQHVWVWILFALIVLIPIVLWLNGLRKTAVLQKKQVEQDSKLANLQLVSLSSQFRPHFILNALNAIGAGSDEKPEQESILSRLGESVNLIFNHAKDQKTTHSFRNEWKLVLNVIEIHKLIYLKELELTLPAPQSLNDVADIQIPLGLLQIPVENALLHGLNNRLIPPWILNIDIEIQKEFVTVLITENGVGRIKSATLSNFTKHGTGAKNLEEVIRILNENTENKIGISYEDNIYTEGAAKYGTKVIVDIPKNAGSSATN